MKRKTITSVVAVFFFVCCLGMRYTTASAQCVNCSNAYLTATDLNAIEYDNLVSTFHSSLSRQANGDVLVWGELTKSDGLSHNLSPVLLNRANYPGLTGTILKFTGGSRGTGVAQFAVLTTDGLFAWGTPGTMISTALTTGPAFQKIANGLPAGIAPTDVKMLFGTNNTLAILTCSGTVYVLSQTPAARGSGISTGGSATNWSQVTEATAGNPFLSSVVALRGSDGVLIALKSDGTVWTWGSWTYLGNNSATSSTNTRATQMTIPTGVTPKMIGVSASQFSILHSVSYYILGANGSVYSLGNNSSRQLGDFTTTERTSWVQVKSGPGATDILSNVAWISPNEHDGLLTVQGINVLTADNTVWAWGEGILVGLPSGANNPTINPGGLTAADQIIAVETGGHTSIVIKKCSGKFGYVGHRINGSMGDGTSVNATEPVYNFTQTALVDICGASSGAAVLYPLAATPHVGDQLQLSAAPAGGVFTVVSGPAAVTPQGGLTILNNNADILLRYAISTPCPGTAEITIKAADIALPAVFGNLEALIKDGQLQVNFTTLTEQNNDHFEIEGSRDGKQFVTIGTLASATPDGNAASATHYHFEMPQNAAATLAGLSLAALGLLTLRFRRRNRWLWALPLLLALGTGSVISCNRTKDAAIQDSKPWFIRIKQVDKDGKASYSKTVRAVPL